MPELSYLDLVSLTDGFPYPGSDEYRTTTSSLFTITSHDGLGNLGYVLPRVVEALRKEKIPILIIDDKARQVRISEELDSIEKRSTAINELSLRWKTEKKFQILSGWRSELFPVYYPAGQLYFTIERAACPLFGFVSYGAHLTAYIPSTETSPLKIWISRRAATKATYPNMLDNTVAGGIAYPYGAFDTLVKESEEEAGYEPDFIRENAVNAGAASYYYVRTSLAGGESGWLQPEIEFCYDLKVNENSPAPKPVDGEVSQFYLWDVDKVQEELRKGNFKPNTALITIDFLIRHGIITPETEPDYLEIVSRMHRRLEHPLC
ncbi:NUDIX hydrolase domain-like protein [Lipomyces japonicus]|uniref:NUDIX hydrolase domain-like protein n=1 Tax=Lipomyces japonicus TaxID=56871 RepID=UPI0034CFDA88